MVLASVLLVAGVSIAFVAQSITLAQKKREITVQASILASTVTAALSFNDHAAAQEYVDALKANTEILQASIYDAQGARFASFARPPEPPPPPLARDLGAGPGANRIVALVPVQQGRSQIGLVYLNVITERASRRYMRLGIILLMATMMGVIVAVLVIAHRALTRVNERLEQRSRELADSNASLQQQIAERARVEEALRQAQKMESIGQLTGGVAHDFNNLLQIILSSLAALRRRAQKWSLPDEAMRDFDRFMDAAAIGGERAAALTRQLLAFARKTPLQPVKLDVNALVAGMSELLRRTLGESVVIESALAGGIWRCFADQNQLASALLNLAVNARDAMKGGGTLTIRTSNQRITEAEIRDTPDMRAGDYVVLAVSDTGVGMSPEVLERAFEPFFTTKDVGQGTGLGLSQVYGFVNQSGGHIRIISTPGRGTTVRLCLPRLLEAMADAPANARPPEIPRARQGETVLVVEDEDQVRNQSVEMLRELGYGVKHAADGHAALRMLEVLERVTLLFTDVGLPGGLDGGELAREVLRRQPGTKVLFASGYTRDAIARGGRLEAGVTLLSKPFTFESLACKVREVLDE
jgi:signal transduction histidine kinase/CheY-like chemotaxis protein